MLPPYARLKLIDDVICEMFKERIVIGRSTTGAPVDVDVGKSSFVSRQHLELLWETNTLKLRCNGKNGIFVDRSFRPGDSHPRTLPLRCVLRFPSTSICIQVEQCRRISGRRRPRSRLRFLHRSSDKRATMSSDSASDTSSHSSVKRRRPNTPLTDSERESSEEMLADTTQDEKQQQKLNDSVPLLPTAHVQSRTRRKQALVPTNVIRLRSTEPSEIIGEHHSIARSDGTPPETSNLECPGSEQAPPRADHPIGLNCTGGSLQDPTSLVTVSTSSAVPARRFVLTAVPIYSPQSKVTTLLRLTDLERGDRNNKPPYSYAQLIAQAIASQPERQITLSGIYEYISQNYPYYHAQDKGWQNSVRHNLSLNRHFIKVPRSQEDHGKGCFWRIDPMFETKLLSLAFQKRRARGYDGLFIPPTNGSATWRLPSLSRLGDVSAGSNVLQVESNASLMSTPPSLLPTAHQVTSGGDRAIIGQATQTKMSSATVSIAPTKTIQSSPAPISVPYPVTHAKPVLGSNGPITLQAIPGKPLTKPTRLIVCYSNNTTQSPQINILPKAVETT